MLHQTLHNLGWKIGIPLSDPIVTDGSDIDILVRSVLLSEILSEKVIRPTKDGKSRLMAFETKFGYALMGPICETQVQELSCSLAHASTKADDNLSSHFAFNEISVKL